MRVCCEVTEPPPAPTAGPLRRVFMKEADASNFFRKRTRRNLKSQDEIDGKLIWGLLMANQEELCVCVCVCVELELACAGGYIRVPHFGKSKFPHCYARLKIIMLFQKKKRKRKGNEVSDNSQKKKKEITKLKKKPSVES